ncbi:hypothetical protein Glove_50g56 [Diversispora epigaea]|uniref:Uncharacterized protein n=1 Tax=Diversispora epigaea TaxID=1348612 RepID=A0A397JI48_9GLOM|nr:hypothetical protein Glove_50g56 [Diversispora epigaea]
MHDVIFITDQLVTIATSSEAQKIDVQRMIDVGDKDVRVMISEAQKFIANKKEHK